MGGAVVSQLCLWLGPDSPVKTMEAHAEESRASPCFFFRGADFGLGNVLAQLVCLPEDFTRGDKTAGSVAEVHFYSLVPVPCELRTQTTLGSGRQAVGVRCEMTLPFRLQWQSRLCV